MKWSLAGALAIAAMAVLAAPRKPKRQREMLPAVVRPDPSSLSSGGLIHRRRHGSADYLARSMGLGAVFVIGTVVILVRSRAATRILYGASVALAIVRPQRGVLCWIALAGTAVRPLVTIGRAGIYLSAANLPVLLITPSLRWLLSYGPSTRASSQIRGPLVGLATISVLSGIRGMVAPDPSVPGLHRSPGVQLYATFLVLLSVAAALIVGSSLRTARDFRWVWWILIAIGVLQAWPPLTMAAGLTRPPWNVLLESHAAAFVLAALLFAPPKRRWILCLEVAVILVAVAEIVVFQVFGLRKGQWVSGWLALAGSLGTILALWSPRALLLVALIAVLVLFLARGFIQQRLSEAEMKGDFQRFAMWRDALRLAARRPWLGVGPGNYPDYMVRYAHPPLEAGSAAHGVHPGIGSAHGNYPQVAADLGLTGLWTLGWVFTRTFRSGRAVLDRVEDPFLAAMTAGSLGAIGGQLTASVLGDYLLPSYHNGGHANFSTTVYTWILVGTIMALETQVLSASPVSENFLRA